MKPSVGCGAARPFVGARTISFEGETGAYIINLPFGYDQNTPRPLAFAFHGYNRTHSDCQRTDCKGVQSVVGKDAIVVYLKSFSLGWEDAEVRDKNARYFKAVLERTKTEACVDESRVFVMGTSSGASFSNLLACRYGDEIRAAGPVAGSLPEESCKGNPAMVFVHGIDDPHVPFAEGEKARDFFLARSGCSFEPNPPIPAVHGKVRAARDRGQTEHACADYPGCMKGSEVRWCEHSEGGYDGSTHGWPTEGGNIVWDFMKEL